MQKLLIFQPRLLWNIFQKKTSRVSLRISRRFVQRIAFLISFDFFRFFLTIISARTFSRTPSRINWVFFFLILFSTPPRTSATSFKSFPELYLNLPREFSKVNLQRFLQGFAQEKSQKMSSAMHPIICLKKSPKDFPINIPRSFSNDFSRRDFEICSRNFQMIQKFLRRFAREFLQKTTTIFSSIL